MKSIIGSNIKIFVSIASLLALLSISDSCTKSTDYMPGMGGNNGGNGNKGTPGTNEVWIQGNAFTPASITVVEGTQIKWTNKDATTHTVSSSTPGFGSGLLNNGGTYTYTFATAGTYNYNCSIHTTMTAKVIVTPTPTGSASVSIEYMSFQPAIITVAAGTIVTWTNNDSVTHTVTSDSPGFDSGTLAAAGAYGGGGTFSYTFSTPGTYPYHCAYHAGMTGKVIVN
jgi:plastocyanin